MPVQELNFSKKTYREKAYFWEKINSTPKGSQIDQFLKREEIKSIISFGSSIAIHFWRLYHEYRFNELVGIEYENEKKSIEEMRRFYGMSLDNYESVYPFYSDNFQVEEDDLPKIKSQEEFRSIFNIRYSTDLAEVISEYTNKKFDIIDCTLFFTVKGVYPRITEWLPLMANMLSDEGLFYFEMRQQKIFSIDFEMVKELIKAVFPSGFLFNFEEEEESGEKKTSSIIFINHPFYEFIEFYREE